MRASKLLRWIVACGLLLRVLLWCFQVVPAGDDGERYYTESHNLVTHGVFSTDTHAEPHPTAHDLPLWPGTMAGLLWATGSKAATVRLAGALNIALMFGAVLFLLSALGRPPFNADDRGKAVAAAILLFLPDSFPYSLFHMPDPMALFFLCGAIAFFFRGVYGSRGWLLASAGAFGGAILSKPICLPVACAFFLTLPFLLNGALLRRCGWALLCFVLMGLILAPWFLRNKRAFGTAGLTTISGTNLYSCNWNWMVQSWPEPKRSEALRQNAAIEAQANAHDLMTQSNILGAYAKEQLMAHLPDYALFTLQRHPRLYAGTGTVALLRYLGEENACYALTKRTPQGNPTNDFSKRDLFVGWGFQVAAFTLLALCYVAIVGGWARGLRHAFASRHLLSHQSIAFGVAFGGVLLLAVVIGPVVATRYRFIMIPFFAMLASLLFGGGREDAEPLQAS